MSKATGFISATLKELPSQQQMLYTVMYYDKFGRVIQQINEHLLSGYDVENYSYDFEGNLTAKRVDHIINAGLQDEEQTILKWRYEYDHSNRLTHIYHQINSQDEELIVLNKYNELGELIEKNLHAMYAGEEFSDFAQSVDYRYNTRGWLTRINQSNLGNDNIFIDGDLNIASDEMVSKMIIDTITVYISNEEIAEGRDILHLEFHDSKSLELQKISDPTQTRTITANEVETIDIKQNRDTTGYDRLISLDSTQFSFIITNIQIDENTDMSYIWDTIAEIVTQELIQQQITNENTQTELSSKVNEFVKGNVGVVYFNDDNTDLFGMELLYNEGFSSLNGPRQYNGNISGMKWQVKGTETIIRGYGFDYDDLSRITTAQYAEYNNYNWSQSQNNYSVTGPDVNGSGPGIKYDENGNILSLTRRGCTDRTAPSFGLIDELSYHYDGNQLLAVDDNVADPTFTSNDFRDNSTSGTENQEYFYDSNGNLTSDDNKNIQSIMYNHLNLPSTIDFGNGNKIIYLYNSTGIKLKKEVWNENNTTSPVLERYYCGNFIYVNGQSTLEQEMVLFEEGRIIPQADATYEYEYFLTDHLGNTRAVFRKEGTGVALLQENHYYPFGMEFTGTPAVTMDVANFYKYNGKELQEDGFDLDGDGVIESRLLWYDYEARYFNTTIALWNNIDPLSENYYSLSHYSYVANNPIKFIDPDGRSITDYGVKKDGTVKRIGPVDNKPDRLFLIDENNKKIDINDDGEQTEGVDFVVTTDKEVLNELSESKGQIQNIYDEVGETRTGASTKGNELFNIWYFAAENTDVEWSFFNEGNGIFTIGTYGLDNLSPGMVSSGLTNAKTMIHNHVGYTNYEAEKQSLYGDRAAAKQVDYTYYTFMPNSNNLFRMENSKGKAGKSLNISKSNLKTLILK